MLKKAFRRFTALMRAVAACAGVIHVLSAAYYYAILFWRSLTGVPAEELMNSAEGFRLTIAATVGVVTLLALKFSAAPAAES